MALLTQTDMAKYLKIAYPTYNAKENGRNKLDMQFLDT